MSEAVATTAKPVGQEKIDGLLVQWSKEVLGYDPEYRSSLPMETSDDKKGVYAIAESECVKGSELINTTFTVTDYICHSCVIRNRADGELVPAIRTLLLGPGHLPVHFVAQAAVLFLMRSARHVPGQPAWDPPVEVTLKQVPCSGGHTYKFQIPTPGKRKK
jgi:hypothetical protein